MRSTDTLSSPPKVSHENVSEDLSLLLYALQNGYGGRNFVPKEIWGNVIAQLAPQNKLFQSEMPTTEFCEKISSILDQVPDAHLSAMISHHSCSPEGRAIGQVGQNINAAGEKPWRIEWKKVGQIDIAILAISKSWDAENPAWNGLMDKVRQIKQKAGVLILDLRGNPGGSDIIPREIARILYGGEYPLPLDEIVKSKTSATLALRVNSYQYKISDLKEQKKEIPDYLKQKLKDAEAVFISSTKVPIPAIEIEKENSPRFPPQHGGFGKPIYALIDRACASACESTLEALEAYPHLILVGEHTTGAMHFGNVGKLVLHHSQIVIGIATDFWKFKDGRFWEKKGYVPNVQISPGQDALTVTLRRLQERASDPVPGA